jgi:hypothetical protein
MGYEAIFIEIVRNLRKKRHYYVECIPLPKDVAGDAPLYFQKAISEVFSLFGSSISLTHSLSLSLSLLVRSGVEQS